MGVNGNGPAVSVVDGDLVWRDEPIEGEEGVLADCEALVEAGFAEWVEESTEE